jgi:hypothetical protein
MKKLITLVLIFASIISYAQIKTDAQLLAQEAATITGNTTPAGITKTVLGNMLKEIIKAKSNVIYGANATGTNTYAATTKNPFNTYAQGQFYLIYFENGNSSATATLQLNSIASPVTLKRFNGSDLQIGDIQDDSYYFLVHDGTNIRIMFGGAGGGIGSVGLSMPAMFNVSSSPLTSDGTIAVTFNNQTANTVIAGPTSGGAGSVTFRSLVVADIPDLSSLYIQNLQSVLTEGSDAIIDGVLAVTFTGEDNALNVTTENGSTMQLTNDAYGVVHNKYILHQVPFGYFRLRNKKVDWESALDSLVTIRFGIFDEGVGDFKMPIKGFHIDMQGQDFNRNELFALDSGTFKIRWLDPPQSLWGDYYWDVGYDHFVYNGIHHSIVGSRKAGGERYLSIGSDTVEIINMHAFGGQLVGGNSSNNNVVPVGGLLRAISTTSDFAAGLGLTLSVNAANSDLSRDEVMGSIRYVYTDATDATEDVDLAFNLVSNGAQTERLEIKANGAYEINGSAGTAGQLLKSQGSGAAATWYTLEEVQTVAVAQQVDEITTGTGKFTYTWPHANCTITRVVVSMKTAQTSGSIVTFNVRKNGSTIFSTKPTIDNNEKTTATAATASVLSVTSVTEGDEIIYDIDQCDPSTAAIGPVVHIYFKRN